MEGSEEILLSSLKSFGISIPEQVASVGHLPPPLFVSICRQSLELLQMGDEFSPVSVSDSDSMGEKFKICSEISSAFKNLGYIGDASYEKFLYPSEEDVYKFIRFLVERLSESSEGITISGGKDAVAKLKAEEESFERISNDGVHKSDNEGFDLNLQKVEEILKDIRLNTELQLPASSSFDEDDLLQSHEPLDILHNLDELAVDDTKNDLFSVLRRKNPNAESGRTASPEVANEEDDKRDLILEEKADSHLETSSRLQHRAGKSGKEDKVLEEELSAKALELKLLEEEFQLLKAATDMTFDQSHPTEFYLEQIHEQVDAKAHDIAELKTQWDAIRNSLEEKRRNLEDSICTNHPVAQQKLQKLREVELETQSVTFEIGRREEEYTKLSVDVKKQPKVASRRSYIERIKEITKNSRKLDTDIERIIRETRELQLESNHIQDRLHRTYAIADEMVFREAKKDQVGRQAYRHLTSIHESFEQISEEILSTDRIRREVADLGKKLSAISSGSVNVDKLEADLNAIRKENEYLEQHIQNNEL